MKKRIICSSAAILMTGLTVSLFTSAEPSDREYVLNQYVRSEAPAVSAVPEFVAPGNVVTTTATRLPG